MTAKSLTPGDHERLRTLGVRTIIQKGDVDREELLGRVRELLGSDRVFAKPSVEEVVQEKRQTPPALQPDPKKSGRLLIVEDNPDNLTTLHAILGGRYELAAVTNGEEALSFLAAEIPALVFLDMQLPKMDGLEMLKELRKTTLPVEDLKIVALTASAMAGDRERFLEAGCIDYLSKPIDLSALEQLLKLHLG